jgi:hypothetical protein
LNGIYGGKTFSDKVDFAAPWAKKSIRDELRSKGFNVTSAFLVEACFEIMKVFLKRFKDVETPIYPVDVADSQNTATGLQLIRDVKLKGQELIKDGMCNAISSYDIAHVYSENIVMADKPSVKDKLNFFKIKNSYEDSKKLDNKIPLCLNCANLYLENSTVEDYHSLVNTKKAYWC